MNVATNSEDAAGGMEKPEASADRGAVLIAGPTASGKSALALRLAAERDGVVINTDSMQVYAELVVLTARPSEDDMERVPHMLYGFVPAAQRYSVALWRDAAAAALDAARASGRLPIFVGGTGLYFKALTEGIAAVPPVDPAIRASVAERAGRLGVPVLHAELALRDAEGAALLKPTDRTRVMRALEVLEATGTPLRHWQRERVEPPLIQLETAEALVVEPARELLYRRIEQRFDAMVEAGALAEVGKLLALQLDEDLPAMKAIGVREFREHLEGRIGLAEAIERAKMETRRYAKRQSTWFRHQMPGWRRIAAGDDYPAR